MTELSEKSSKFRKNRFKKSVTTAYLERPRFGFGEQTEQESSEQLLTELFDGVRAP